MIVAVAGIGMLMRHLLRRRAEWVQDLATLATQVVVAVAVVTLLIAGDTALFGIIPTSATLTLFGVLGASAVEAVVFGSAPLDPSPGLAAAMGIGFAVVAILLDHLVTHRSAVLAVLLTGAVGAVPMIVTLGETNVVWFVLFGAVALLVFRHTARRHPESPRRSSASVAVAIGAAAMATTIAVAPMLPVSTSLAGTGVGVTVDASLRLGDDLRQPNPVEVLTVAAKGETAPYLRLTTLSRFDGRVWQPDDGDLQSQDDGFGPPEWGEDITTEEQTTSIRVLRMSSSWLPVPYPATTVQGLSNAWRIAPENRTLHSRGADAVGNDYTVTSSRLLPTLEQIRAIDAAAPVVDPDAEPVELPGIIGRAGHRGDRSREHRLRPAHRAAELVPFAVRLLAGDPGGGGFDGTGAEAVAEFLDARSGYCVHFAGAFALMAESLGMQGAHRRGISPRLAHRREARQRVGVSVTSDRLHSWPEVLFPGVGWVPFEPTASLGVPTAFRPGATQGSGSGTPSAPAPTTAPQAEQTSGPEVDRNDAGGDSASGGELRRLDPTPVALTTLGVVVLLLLPALIRLAERRARLSRRAVAIRPPPGRSCATHPDRPADSRHRRRHSPRARGRSGAAERGGCTRDASADGCGRAVETMPAPARHRTISPNHWVRCSRACDRAPIERRGCGRCWCPVPCMRREPPNRYDGLNRRRQVACGSGGVRVRRRAGQAAWAVQGPRRSPRTRRTANGTTDRDSWRCAWSQPRTRRILR